VANGCSLVTADVATGGDVATACNNINMVSVEEGERGGAGRRYQYGISIIMQPYRAIAAAGRQAAARAAAAAAWRHRQAAAQTARAKLTSQRDITAASGATSGGGSGNKRRSGDICSGDGMAGVVGEDGRCMASAEHRTRMAADTGRCRHEAASKRVEKRCGDSGPSPDMAEEPPAAAKAELAWYERWRHGVADRSAANKLESGGVCREKAKEENWERMRRN